MLADMIAKISEVLYRSDNVDERDRFAAMRAVYLAQTGEELVSAIESLPYEAQIEIAEEVEV